MIIVKLMGGLGNQMFQYAGARALALKLKQTLFLDLHFLEQNEETDSFTARSFALDVFNLELHFFENNNTERVLMSSSFLQRLLRIKRNVALQHFDDSTGLTNITLPAYLDGYFQSEKYFSDQRDIIIQDFSFTLPQGDKNESLLKDILITNAVSIHLRRGDYVYKPTVLQVHGVCEIAYYETAMKWIAAEYDNPVFYVFTDDPEWVSQHFISRYDNYNMVLVSNNKGNDSWKDMYLMSCCKHNIIANSSFSWWGAWLNKYPDKKVIAPRNWFAANNIHSFEKDIVPSSWIKL